MQIECKNGLVGICCLYVGDLSCAFGNEMSQIVSVQTAAEMFRQPLLSCLGVQYCHPRGQVWFVGRGGAESMLTAGACWLCMSELNNMSVGYLRHSHIKIRL